MARQAAFKGQFYEADFGKLDKQIHESFLSEKGPGELPVSKRQGKIQAVISPHAGYMFSGPCAAWAYKALGEAEFADVYVILGVDHSGYGKTCYSTEGFETPFGLVRVDLDFAKLVSEKCGITSDPEGHAFEHSIEVQLPFLQFVSKDRLNELKILPIIVSSDIDYKELGLGLKEAIMDSKKNICIIVSSDFTHYGRNYHFIPFSTDVQKRLYDLDEGAIGFIKRVDAKGLVNYIADTGATICGVLGIAVLLCAIKSSKIRLLQYYTSGDIAGDYKNSVGYASILFE